MWFNKVSADPTLAFPRVAAFMKTDQERYFRKRMDSAARASITESITLAIQKMKEKFEEWMQAPPPLQPPPQTTVASHPHSSP